MAGTEQIKPIEFPFTWKGFVHELIERKGMVCLVKRSKDIYWHYEVVKLRNLPANEAYGKHFPAHEHYPSPNEWGIDGFTFAAHELEGARKHYRRLCGRVS
jgi:hypothetical protein